MTSNQPKPYETPKEAFSGQTLPLSALWEGIDPIELSAMQVAAGNDGMEDAIAQYEQNQET